MSYHMIMSYFENITDSKDMNEWRKSYRDRSGGYPIPLAVCHHMSKLMKQYSLSFHYLAILIKEHDGLGSASDFLKNQKAKVTTDDKEHVIFVHHPMGTGFGCKCGDSFMSDDKASTHLEDTGCYYENWQTDVKKRLSDSYK